MADKINELLKYVQKTNPEMTIEKLIEELGKCRYSASGLIMTWQFCPELQILNLTQNLTQIYEKLYQVIPRYTDFEKIQNKEKMPKNQGNSVKSRSLRYMIKVLFICHGRRTGIWYANLSFNGRL